MPRYHRRDGMTTGAGKKCKKLAGNRHLMTRATLAPQAVIVYWYIIMELLKDGIESQRNH